MTNLFSALRILFALLVFNSQISAQVMRVVNNKVGVNNNSPTYHMDVTGDVRGQWFRTVGARGLYAQSYATYLTPNNVNYWSSRSNRGWYIRNRDNSVKGYLYHNNANGFGLLDADGTWAVRIENNSYTALGVNGTTRVKVNSNGFVDMTGTADASGSTNTGVLELAGTLRLDGNEIITNTNNTLYLQHYNNGDLRVDNTTLHVDASANTIITPKIIDGSNSAYYSDPSYVSRLNYVYPRVTNTGYVGSNSNRWFRGYFTNMHRVTEHVLSDARMKENIKNIDSPLDKVLSLKGKTYNYIQEVMAFNTSEDAAAIKYGEKDTSTELMSNSSVKKNAEEKYVDHKMPEGTDEAPELVTPETIVHEEQSGPFEDAVPSAEDQASVSKLNSEDYTKDNTFGFIAQEVKEVLPEVVSYDKENDLYSMDYTAIIPLLVESIKMQQAQIEAQQKQINELKTLIEK